MNCVRPWIRVRAVGFVYSWSRFSAILTAFTLVSMLQNFGVQAVFLLINGAMGMVMLTIGLVGPRTRNVALESIAG